jgi:hypothetical protein
LAGEKRPPPFAYKGKLMSSVAALKPELDMKAAEAFSETVGNILNSGAVSVMLSIGHRTGLLDTMAGLAPSTSSQIANAAEPAASSPSIRSSAPITCRRSMPPA